VVGGFDTGFVGELWDEFGPTHGPRLVLAIAELDWRLRRQQGPSVFGPIWDQVREQLRATSPNGLRTALMRLDELAHTQPFLMLELLDEIRLRLRSDETADASSQDGCEDDTETSVRAYLTWVTI